MSKKISCELAASYREDGTLWFIDGSLKRMIGDLNAINSLTDNSWENVLACMMQKTHLEPLYESRVSRSNTFAMSQINVFKFKGCSSDAAVVKKVFDWFKDLIKDEDIEKDTAISIDTMAKIMAQTGARATGPLTLIAATEHEKENLTDVGILRYPDNSHPYFKLYRIGLTTSSDCSRVLMVQKDKNYITGNFDSMKFKPGDDVIANMIAEAGNYP